ncbi:peptidoglycan peptidase [Paracoccus pacificus]|uniref:Peptidoglycan peptidase n=1 Tax=Paracoccus pacificus TaxID=1463598 RepID=A0ABW4RAV8_9RHOB
MITSGKGHATNAMVISVFMAWALAAPAAGQDGGLPEPGAEQPDYAAMMAEAAWDWRPGDLIFRNDVNKIDDALKRSFGLRWASVGILRPSSGGPRVVFVDPEKGVTEDMLYAYTEGLSPDDYAVYRPRDLNPGYDPNADLMVAGPMAKFALSIAYGAPQDKQFLFANGAFYSAELAYESALNAGIVLGAPTRLGALLKDPKTLDPRLGDLLEAHRYCQYEQSLDDCRAVQLQELSLVTTDSLIASGALDRVYP